MDPLSIARYGMMAAVSRLDTSATRIASDPEGDLAPEIVGMAEAKHEFAAQAQVVRIADEMWRVLTDDQARQG